MMLPPGGTDQVICICNHNDHEVYMKAFLGTLSLLLCAAGCRTDITPPPDSAGQVDGTAQVLTPPGPTPNCVAGCIEPDPEEEAPGYFLGSSVTPILCFGGFHTDADQDGVSDFCEQLVAEAFAPELYYYSQDYIDGHPHWAAGAGFNTDGLTTIDVIYLLSYHVDYGTNNPLCNNAFVDQWCAGHAGDSEWIHLSMLYDYTSQHWYLTTARYSEHKSHNIYVGSVTSTPKYPTALHYPEVPGGYPRSYVAVSKHANYASDAECDAGGTFGFDTCLSDRVRRISGAGAWNIGSRQVPLKDCFETWNPVFQGNGVIECYWTVKRFSGWLGQIPDASDYSGILNRRGWH